MFKFLRKSLLYIVLAPYAVFGIGAACNQVVLVANNDTFPVRMNPIKAAKWHPNATTLAPSTRYPHGVEMLDDTHCAMTEYTHFNWLADNFYFHDSGIISIGDMFISIGGWGMEFTPFVWFGAFLRKQFE